MIFESEKRVIELINSFFTKAVLLICKSKSLNELDSDISTIPTDACFNINRVQDTKIQRELKAWSDFDGKKELTPLVVETYLDLRLLTSSQTVTLKDQDGNQWNVCKGGKKTEVMLERWLIELDSSTKHLEAKDMHSSENIYKQLVLLFRYLYTLTKLLPANNLYNRIKKLANNSDSLYSLVHIGTRVLDGSAPILSKGRVGLSRNIIATYNNIINETNFAFHLEQKKITPIITSFGSLQITVSYRRDCDFHITETDDYFSSSFAASPTVDSQRRSLVASSSHAKVFTNSERFISVSPKSVYCVNPSSHNSSQIKLSSSKIQLSKVGSVGSGTYSSARNTSGVISGNILKAQRSDSVSMETPIATDLHQHLVIGSSSVGSGGSKYSSSFDRIRRHSSIRQSENMEKNNKALRSNENGSDDLLDFMKLLDDKQELNIKKLYGNTADISSSLTRFQSMKSNNDTLSEDLSMSCSLELAHGPQIRYRSNSYSPVPAFSPSIQYSSIPKRLSRSRNLSQTDLTAKKSSSDRMKSLILSRTGSFLDPKRQYGTAQQNIVESSNTACNDDEDDILLSRSHISNVAGNKLTSVSPQSVKSVPSYNRHSLSFKPTSNFPYPTTVATPAHAKLHKASINLSSENQHNLGKKDQENNQISNGDEDDELLFFMSDMNLSGQ